MTDVFSFSSAPGAKRTLADFHIKRMVLSPAHWKKCSLKVDLNWSFVHFTKSNKAHVPADKRGVYSFCVQPRIAKHPACSYLLYIGMVENQGFRARYEQYLADSQAGESSRRPHVTEMLEKWEGYLWFCYASIAKKDLIEKTEDKLLAAYLPPTNKDYRWPALHRSGKARL